MNAVLKGDSNLEGENSDVNFLTVAFLMSVENGHLLNAFWE